MFRLGYCLTFISSYYTLLVLVMLCFVNDKSDSSSDELSSLM